MCWSSVNSESGTLRFKIRIDVYFLETLLRFFDIIMIYRSGLSCLLTLLTISDKNINKTDYPFRKSNVCIKIFVNLNRSDTKHCLRKAL